ncbi:epididymal secretory protein 4-like isoform X2 [Rhineura floridana]|uniref:epididymal secretory protein 4-like isoform X2 n=1 Tax=Rhineura floridana TaxID=261503 RepID=UPI002AC8456F|nr:epididymal secretory protein 4-like isoform X2 [Rhineura floridana]
MLRAYEKTTTRMIVVLLLMLGLSSAYMFTVAGHIPVQSDFDPWKAAGLWHPIAMVTDIDQVPEIEEVRVQTDSKLIPVSDGDFKLNSYIKVAGDCRPYNRLLRRTEKPGVFTSQHGNQLRVMAVDYEDYIIVHAEIETHIAMYLSEQCTP